MVRRRMVYGEKAYGVEAFLCGERAHSCTRAVHSARANIKVRLREATGDRQRVGMSLEAAGE
jgi:hypothetical protein